MCALCGVFGVDDHWSFIKTSLPEADPVKRRKQRMMLVHTVNRFLKNRNLVLSDWQGVSYLLSSATGKSVVVNNVSEIWLAMDKEFGGAFDPISVHTDIR